MTRIAFGGDFFYDYPCITEDIEKISDFIRQRDLILVINLEAPLVAAPFLATKRGPNLFQSEISIEVLKKLNVVGVCLANNHIMDYGSEALAQTLKLLDENEIKHTGAGTNLAEARIPMEFEVGDKIISILNYGWEIEEVIAANEKNAGAAPRDFGLIQEDIQKLSNAGRDIVVCMHWGFEYNLMPQPYDISLAHDMVKMGAKLIIGHHPHVIQAYERYQESAIYYSIGNFYFGSMRGKYDKTFRTKYLKECNYGLLVVAELDGMRTMPLTIYYDKEMDQSRFLEENYSIENISHATMGRKYLKKVKSSKKHVNPVLTENEFFNKIKLWYLEFIVRKVLRKLWLIKKNICRRK